MKDFRDLSVSDLVQRLKALKDRPECNFNPPAWMLDESRIGSDPLTPEEQQDWAECVCKSMRSIVASTFLIECVERWGTREGERVFKCGNISLGLTQALIENVLIVHVETPLMEHHQDQRYLAVFHFYQANEQRRATDGYSWFRCFLDDVFTAVASQLNSGEPYEQPTFH